MKKILFCANSLCIGGIEKSLINLLKKIDYKKFQVDLMLESKSGELLEQVPENINIIEYKVYNLKNKILQKVLNYINQLRWIMKYKNKYDTSICYATYSYAANKISRISSKNKILFIHSDYTKLYNEDELKKFFDTRKITKFNKIIFVSNESKENLLKYYPNIDNKSKVINNIIDVDNIINLSKEKSDIKFAKNNINLLFVGRLEEQSKNILFQLELLKELKSKYKNIKLYIIGEGKDKEKYISFIKNNDLENEIILLGQKNNPYPYIKECDYLLLTSNYEGYPVIFNEGIVLKKNIISTIKISDDYTEIGNNFGFLIPKNLDKSVKKISNIIENKLDNTNKIDIVKINNKRIKKIEELVNEE